MPLTPAMEEKHPPILLLIYLHCLYPSLNSILGQSELALKVTVFESISSSFLWQTGAVDGRTLSDSGGCDNGGLQAMN
jgi:hypothetical protein